MHAHRQYLQNGPPYFATVVSYGRKMFIKLVPELHSVIIHRKHGCQASQTQDDQPGQFQTGLSFFNLGPIQSKHFSLLLNATAKIYGPYVMKLFMLLSYRCS
jgi:hypothetical protein